ncbi:MULTISPECIES: hypothetical protein [unclassified Pseudoalteromonas]|uniref:hypothetical protein n=1 Tax=unclassified Pseudoalteromonas TaxID=194690 RepID=UPI0005AB2F15|nr:MULTISPECIES: hypothetical protein [unclassified Pseudoalteromonas]
MTDVDSNGKNHTGSQGQYFRILNAKTGELLKTSPAVDNNWSGIDQLVEFDDPNTDRLDVFGVGNGAIYRYNFESNTSKKIEYPSHIKSITNTIFEGNPVLIGGDNQGRLLKLELDGSLSEIATFCDNQSVLQLGALSINQILFSGNKVTLYSNSDA